MEWSGPNNRRDIGRLLVAIHVIRDAAIFLDAIGGIADTGELSGKLRDDGVR